MYIISMNRELLIVITDCVDKEDYSIILKLAAHMIVNITNKLSTDRVDLASLA